MKCPYDSRQIAKRKYLPRKREFIDAGSDAKVYQTAKNRVLMFTDSWNKVLWLYELGIIVNYWGYLPDSERWVIELPLLNDMNYETWLNVYCNCDHPSLKYAQEWAFNHDLYEFIDNRCSNWLVCPITGTVIPNDVVCLWKDDER